MKRPSFLIAIVLTGSLLGYVTASGAGSFNPRASGLSEEEAFEVGTEAYIYGYPLITMEMTRRVMTNTVTPKDNHAPMGQFHHSRTYPDASFRDVTAPNADTLYSTAWLDLSREPFVLAIPDEGSRFFLMPMLSGWTDVFAVPGKRTTGTKAQRYAITGPNWKGPLPAGLKELKSPTSLVWIVGRTYCTGTPEDYKAAHAIQDQYELFPLSALGKPFTPSSGKVDPAIDMKTPVRDQVNRLSAANYFAMLAQLLKDNPPTLADAPMVAKLASLGVVAGEDFDPTKLSPAAARGLDRVPAAAFARIMEHFNNAGTMSNGWSFSTATGAYGTNYLQRAFIAAVGLGANLPEDAIYPSSKTNIDGVNYSGAREYVLHFEPGQTPPVKAFWSLTMYDENFFFVANPLNRFTLSPRNPLKYNRDGSLDLYLQHESPGKAHESNWLPAPKGVFSLMLRLYWPKEEALSGTWKLPSVVEKTAIRDVVGSKEATPPTLRPEDAKALAAASEAFRAAYNKGDARAVADLFTEDAEVVGENGEKVVGRKAIAGHFAARFEEDPKGAIELKSDAIRFLGADAARETGRSITIPGGGGAPEVARYTVLYVKQGGRWLQDSVEESPEPNLTPHERLLELSWMLGHWVDERDAGIVRTECRWSSDGHFLLRDFTVHAAGQLIPGGQQRIGWDAERGQFKSWLFDSEGGHVEAYWSRTDKDTWTIRGKGVLADGKTVEGTQVVSFIDKNQFRWKSIDRVVAGQSEPDSPEIILVRTPPEPSTK